MGKGNEPADVFKKIHIRSKEECWPWKGKVNTKDGRPYITIQGVRRPAYIVVLELCSGEKAEGRYVLHSCDFPICCNPHHLSWGTHQDNMNDMKERERHGLPRTVVRSIYALLVEGRTHREIASLYGVSRETITALNRSRREEKRQTDKK